MKLSFTAFLATATTVSAFVVPATRTFTATTAAAPTQFGSNQKSLRFLPSSTTTTTTTTVITIGTKNTQLWDSTTAAAVTADEPDKSSGSSSGGGGGTATVPELIFNLVKGIVGAGVLGLPAGIVAYGNAPGATLPALGLITVIGMLSAYGFGLIGRVCAFTGTTSFREAWSESISPKTAWLPAVSVTFKTICAVLAYSMILGDTFSSLAGGAGYVVSPTKSLLAVTSLVLLPLCLLKNLSSLAPFSLLGSIIFLLLPNFKIFK